MAANMDARVYRTVVREVNRASISPRVTRPSTLATNFRLIFEQGGREQPEHFVHDVENAVTFLRSQRLYKSLLDRYNPLHDLTTEQRIHSTARRVGLDMPVRAPDDEEK